MQALEAGADEFLTKPFRVPRLKARVGNLLESRRRLRERFDYSTKLVPRDSVANQMDLQFIQRVISTIEKNLADFEFDVDALARQSAVSRRQLFRKVKAVTGSTPNMQIRAMRPSRHTGPGSKRFCPTLILNRPGYFGILGPDFSAAAAAASFPTLKVVCATEC